MQKGANNERLVYRSRTPSETSMPKAFEDLTKVELYKKLSESYQKAMKGEVYLLDSVFDELEQSLMQATKTSR